MAEINASIIGELKPPAIDPLATIGKLQGVQQGALQNKLLGLQLQGKQALGQIIGQNTDPQTGKTDWDKVSAAASQSPQASIMMPELMGQVLDRQIKEQQLGGASLDLQLKKWQTIGNAATSLLAEKDPLTREGVIKTLSSDLVGSGLFNDPQSITQLTNFVQNLPTDDAGLRKAIGQYSLASNMTVERLQTLKGAPSTLDTGGQVIQQQVSPLTGGITVNGVVDKSRSPEGKAALVQVWDPAQKRYVLKPSGQVVGDMAPGATPGAPAAPGAPQPPAGGVLAGPAMGEQETATSNVQQAQALQQRAAIVPTRRAALSNIENQLDAFQPGPKADLTYALGALATQFGMKAPSTAKGVAAQEEFNKLAAQIALDQWGALGGSGSNEQLATTMHANPNQAMSKMGIKNVVALLKGNEDAIGAQYDAWKKYSGVHGASSYGDFLAGWNKYYDPRVFQAQHMEAGAVKVMLQKMTPDERKTFERDKSIAQQAGWLGGQ